MSKRAIIAIGSNSANAEAMFDRAMEEISEYEDITVAQSTRRVWTEPIASKGITADSPRFLNSLIAIDTSLGYDSLDNLLKEVEAKLDSAKADKLQGRVALDLDILSYNNCQYHLEDWKRNYIQTLIQEL